MPPVRKQRCSRRSCRPWDRVARGGRVWYNRMIARKTAAELEKIRVAGRVVAEVLEAMAQAIVPGMTRTADLDQLAARLCRQRGAVAAFLGYRGYPASTCISVNEAVVHGIPGDQLLMEGDIVSLDFAC